MPLGSRVFDRGRVPSSPFKQAVMFNFVKVFPDGSPVSNQVKYATELRTVEGEGLGTMEGGTLISGEFPLEVVLDESNVLCEESRLQTLGLFFVALGAVLARGFLEEWVNKNWKKKNILVDSFRYLGNGVFMFFFQEPGMAKLVLEKNKWCCGHSLVKTIPWGPDIDISSLKKNSEVKWTEIKGLDPTLYPGNYA
eukprot:Gb_24108 [translate_table: standard]